MGKVSTLCRPEISFESPQITPPLGLTTDAEANPSIRQLGKIFGLILWHLTFDILRGIQVEVRF